MCMDKSNWGIMLERVAGASTPMEGHKKGKDLHVKFIIKSFKVPEIYIEVPEATSVGSLKRTLMEAITAIPGNGVRVGAVLQGKKVRDDKRTLQQAVFPRDADEELMRSPATPMVDSGISNASVDPPFISS
ncbi:telomere repeat-binding protein 2-like [Salvia splendens]|uniref:telomere repeat-binding protein 2-like n=1 Tax=Salvia splendens TaxID=180675 RepID=UPI001C256E2E|nr:telomere repeat-binding protein 2-like [Salvia splendens]